MLIECDYCGAPLDVTAKQDVARCKYCGKSSQVAHLRQVASQTPPGWRPPATWTPPAHVPAPSDHALRLRRRVSRLLLAAILVPVLGTVAAGVIVLAIGLGRAHSQQQHVQSIANALGRATPTFTLDQTASASEGAQSAAEQFQAAMRQVQEQLDQVQGITAGATTAGPLFEGTGALDLAERFRKYLGARSVQALQVGLYPSYASLQVRSPGAPTRVDRYTYRNGTFQGPEPVRLHVRGKLEDNLFTLSDVYLDEIPSLASKSIDTLGYDSDAKVSHVIIEKNLPFSKDTVIRVYVSGSRDSGRVDYSHTGKQLRVYR